MKIIIFRSSFVMFTLASLCLSGGSLYSQKSSAVQTRKVVGWNKQCSGTAIVKQRRGFTCVLVEETHSQIILTITPRRKTTKRYLRIVMSRGIPTNVEHKLSSTSTQDFETKASFQDEFNGSPKFLEAQLIVYTMPDGASNEVALKFSARKLDSRLKLDGILYAVVGTQENITEIKKIPKNELDKFQETNRKSWAASRKSLPSLSICAPSKLSGKMFTKKISILDWDLYKENSYLGLCRVEVRALKNSIFTD